MKGVNEKLIDLLIESEIIRNDKFSKILGSFSVFILLYLFLLIIGTIVEIRFINYVNVGIISNILLVFISMLSILWIIYFAKKGKDGIINKDILKEKIFNTMSILKNNKIGEFNLVNSKNFTNYKTFVQRTYKNVRIEIGINLNFNNLYFNFYKDEEMRDEFRKYLEKIGIKNELTNYQYAISLKDEKLDKEITDKELYDKIVEYIKYVDDFIKNKGNI